MNCCLTTATNTTLAIQSANYLHVKSLSYLGILAMRSLKAFSSSLMN